MTVNTPDKRTGTTAWMEYLIPAIDEAKLITGYSQVIVIAHSFGGILARSYIGSETYERRGDISHLVTIGTPHEGAAAAYKMWFGGDSSGFVYNTVAENVFERSHPGRNWDGDVSAAEKAYFFHTEVPSLKEMLPIYPCLERLDLREYPNYERMFSIFSWQGVEASSLWKLRGQRLGTQGGDVITCLIASSRHSKTQRTIPIVWPPGTNGYIDADGNLFRLYPEGIPREFTSANFVSGDGTVTTESAKGGPFGLVNGPKVRWTVPGDFDTHAEMPGHPNTLREIKGFLRSTMLNFPRVVSNRDSASATEPNLRVGVTGNALLFITTPKGGQIGINPETVEPINTFDDADVHSDAEYSLISMVAQDPGSYSARIKLEASMESEISIAASFGSNSASLVQRWIGTNMEGRFIVSLPSVADGEITISPAVGMVGGLAATPSTGGVALNWTASTGADSYHVYGKKEGVSSFTLLGTPSGTSFIAPQPWSENGRELWQYSIVPVSADGVMGPASSLVVNKNVHRARFSVPGSTWVAPATFIVHDTSLGGATNWAWDFDGDGEVDSTEQDPEVTFAEPGSYAISLRVTYPNGQTDVSDVTSIFIAPQRGSVAVHLGSEVERPSSARWRLMGETAWRNLEDTALSVAYGDVTVQFEPQADWVVPAEQLVRLVPEDPFRVVRAQYTRKGEHFGGWAERLLGPAATDPLRGGPDADFDDDGLSNFLEFALGLDPTREGESPVQVEAGASGEVVVRFPRNLKAMEIEYSVEGSVGLSEWFGVAPWRREERLTGPDASEVAMYFRYFEASHHFYRVRVADHNGP